MAFRCRPVSAPGALFKQPQPVRRKKLDMGRKPRERDEAHLEAIRQCPCVVCGIDPAGEAAHVRITRQGKPIAGIGNKPDDQWVTPLCHADHMEQHSVGELSFWHDVGIDPLKLAAKLHEVSPNVEVMRSICHLFIASKLIADHT